MRYINKKLTFENVSIENIARKYGTPTYCYSYNKIRENIKNFKKNFNSFSPLICFAIKSNCNVNLIREIKNFVINGSDVSLPVMGTFVVKDLKIEVWRDYFDLSSYQRQLAQAGL